MHSVFKQIKAKHVSLHALCAILCTHASRAGCIPAVTLWLASYHGIAAQAPAPAAPSTLHPSSSHESFVPGVRVQTMNAMLRVSAGQPRVLCGK